MFVAARKTGISIGTMLLLLVPAFIPLSGQGEDQGPGPFVARSRDVAGHIEKAVLSDFSNYTLNTLVLRDDGNLELAKTSGYTCLKQYVVSETTGTQYESGMALDSKNNFMVTYDNIRSGGFDITAQLMSTNCEKLGSEIAVCDNPDDQRSPAIGRYSYDDYIVAWADSRYGGGGGTLAQRLTSNGAKNGTEFIVSDAQNSQEDLAVAVAPNDECMMVWEEWNSSDGHQDLRGQVLDKNCTKVGANIDVSTEPNNQRLPDMAAYANGSYIVVWWDNRSVEYDIYAQRFCPNGTKLSGEIPVCTASRGQYNPAVAVDSRGNAIVTYSDNRKIGEQDIYAQVLDADGAKLGAELEVSVSSQTDDKPDVAVFPDDSFIIVWRRDTFPTDTIWYQMFDKDQNKIGNAKQVNDMVIGPPQIARDSNDNIVVIYTDGITYGAKWVHPYYNSGWVETDDITARPEILRWSDVSAARTLGNSSNSVTLQFSTDGGSSWSPVPANGSLEAAGASRTIRFRATLTTVDNITTPVLYDITAQYFYDNAPSVSLGPDLAAWRNAPVTLRANGTDPDNDTLTYSWSLLEGPPLSYQNTTTSSLAFRPNASGVYKFSVTVSDGVYESPPAFVNVTVSNRPPAVSAGPDIVAQKYDKVQLNATGADPDEDSLTFTWRQVAGNYSYFGNETGESVSFNALKTGNFAFEVVANDGEDESEPAAVNLTVWSLPPFVGLSAVPASATANTTVRFSAIVANYSDPVVAYRFDFGDGADSGWQANNTAEHVYPVPGTYQARVSARDEDGDENVSLPLSITITALNKKPGISPIPAQNATVGKEFTYQVAATDEDADSLAFSISPLIEGMSITAGTGLIRWTPKVSQKGNTTVTVKVSDGKGGLAELAFVITVGEPVVIKPTCSIGSPSPGAKLGGKATIQGKAAAGTSAVTRVEVRIDEGAWKYAAGTENWTYELDAAGLSKGTHTVQARAYDGAQYSDAVSIEFVIDRPAGDGGDSLLLPAIIIIAVIAVACVAAALLLRRKKSVAAPSTGPEEASPPPKPDE